MSFNKKKGETMSVQAISGANINPQTIQQSHAEQPAKQVAQPVVIQQVVETPKKKGGFMEGVSNIVKFFKALGEMTKASLKAVWYGGLTMLGGVTAFWAFGALPQTFGSVQGSFKEIFKQSFKNISRGAKIASGVAAGLVAAFHIVKGILITNKKTANVDHALKTGHRDV